MMGRIILGAALLASGLAPARAAEDAERPANAWRRWGTRVEQYVERELVPERREFAYYDRWGRPVYYHYPAHYRDVTKTRSVEGWIEETPAVLDPPVRVRLSHIDDAVSRGRAYLADKGTDYGETARYWSGDITYEALKNRNAFVPITALVAEALRGSPDAGHREAAAEAADYVRQRSTEDYPREEKGIYFAPWRMGYGLLELLKQERSEGRDAKIKALIQEIDETAQKPSGLRYSYGKWSQDRSANFQVALLTLAVARAKAQGFEVPKWPSKGNDGSGADLLANLAGRIGADNGYYDTSKNVTGLSSAGRLPLCELARTEAGCGGGGKDAIRAAAENFFKHHKELAQTQKWGDQTWEGKYPDGETYHTPHNPNKNSIANYYLLFGLYWLSESLKELDPLEAEDYYHKIGAALVYLQRPDDSWLGSPVYSGKSYGTASAVVTLLNVREGLARAAAARESAAKTAKKP